ncbi:MAG: hypothetical protein ILM98_02870 [Kiritimatiellae bacterium]|nr:hypothetical protein [Kiritimatiellia bacterium]
MAHAPKKVLAVVTRMDVKGKQACERLREFGLRRRWEVFSAECGYASADDFRCVFRQHTGMTPRKWALAPH